MSKKITIPIKGMHCRSCETLVREKLLKVPGVSYVKADAIKGLAEVTLETVGEPDNQKIKWAIEEAGYQVGEENKAWLSKNPLDYKQAAVALIVLLLFYFVLKYFKVFDLNPTNYSNPSGLGSVLLIGLLAGFSTCMALTGGLVLGISSRFSKLHPQAGLAVKFFPHLMFNFGRVVSYLLFGAIIGYIGSALSIFPWFWSLVTFLAGLVMLLIGIQLLGIFPKLNSIRLPGFGGSDRALKKADEPYSHLKAFMAGALTFFLPCGFTQAMQLYAMSTADPIAGALIMGSFALGTSVGLLIVGLFASSIKGKFSDWIFKFVAIIIIFMAIYNIGNGWNLLYGRLVSGASSEAVDLNNSEIQKIKVGFTVDNDITQTEFRVKAGAPVSFEVNPSEDGVGCMSTIMIPGLYNKPQYLEKGKLVVMSFTPTKKGTYPITCAMGIKRGVLIVE